MSEETKTKAVLRGAGGGGKGGGSNDAPNTLRANSTAKVLYVLGEGQSKGIVGGLKGLLIDDTFVMNDGGELLIEGVSMEERWGLPSQAPLATFDGVSTEMDVGVQVKWGAPITRSLTDSGFTSAVVSVTMPALVYMAEKGATYATVAFRIEARYDGGPWINHLGDITIVGKNTSPYMEQYRIPLPMKLSGDSHPWQIRVTRLSADSTMDRYQNDTHFGAITGIMDVTLQYPDTALLGLTFDATKFAGSLPNVEVIYDGIYLLVPTNFDPVARTYSGVWNGTFKYEFSNDPAWFYYTVAMSKRFGLGKFIDTTAIDKWSLYAISQICNQKVSDGYGGLEPRFELNAAITEEHDVYEMMQLIASAFRGMSYWSTGALTATQDVLGDPVALVTPANVVNGEFTYSASSLSARHTVAHVRYKDRRDDYKTAIEVVRDEEGFRRYGERVKEVDGFGITSRAAANRLGRWILLTELNETSTVTYQAGFDHGMRRPGDIVSVMDPEQSNVDHMGRLAGGSTTTSLVLDRVVDLTPGITYTMHVMMPDGSLEEREFTVTGSTNTIAVGPALPAVPIAEAIFAISSPNVRPKPYRIVNVKRVKKHLFEVTGLEIHIPKYGLIDNGVPLDLPNYREDRPLDPPSNLTCEEVFFYDNGVPRTELMFSWQAPSTLLAPLFRIEIDTPGGANLIQHDRYEGVSITIPNNLSGDYTIRVWSLNITGRARSATAATMTYAAVAGALTPLLQVSNVHIVGENGGEFFQRDVEIGWQNVVPDGAAPSALIYQQNRIDVFDNTNPMAPVLIGTHFVSAPRFMYSMNLHRLDVQALGRAPTRNLLFKIRAQDTQNRYGSPTDFEAFNLPFDAPAVTIATSLSQVMISSEEKLTKDFVGMKVHISEDMDFVPNSSNLVYDGPATFMAHPMVTGTYYARVGLYDSWSDTPANYTTAIGFTILEYVVDFDPPATPTGLAATSSLMSDGRVRVIWTWDANTEPDLGGYELEVKEFGGNYVGFSPFSNVHEVVVLPGVQLIAQVRAYDVSNNRSNFSAEVAYTAIADTTSPDTPTGWAATPGFGVVWLKGDASASADFARFEIYESASTTDPDGSTPATFTTTGTSFVRSGLADDTTSHYWIRAVDTSGNKSAWTARISATTTVVDLDITTEKLAGLIDKTSFAAGGTLVEVLPDLPLPTTGNFVGRQVVLESTGKLYRYTSTGWTSGVAASDVTGQLNNTQIETISATKITEQLTSAQIESLAATKVAGTLTDDQLAGISSAKLIGQVVNSQIASVAAGKITDQLLDAQLAGISAAKLAGQITGTQITDGAVSTAKLAAAAVEAGNIAAGAIIAEKMAIGDGRNRAYNSDCLIRTSAGGASGYSLGWNNTGLTTAPLVAGPESVYRPKGANAFYFYYSETPPNATYTDIYIDQVDSAGSRQRYPVEPGARYEFSAWVSPHRCTSWLLFEVLDSSGNQLAYYEGAQLTDNILTRDTPDPYRLSLFTPPLPVGAHSAQLMVRTYYYGGALPHTFVSQPLFARALPNQTVPSKYAPGLGVILDGSGLVARSVQADRILASSITAYEIAASTITGDRIAANTIVADNIAASAITTAKIAVGAVVAGSIAAGAIVAEKLAIGQGRNLLPNTAIDIFDDSGVPSEFYGYNDTGLPVLATISYSGWAPPGARSFEYRIGPGYPADGTYSDFYWLSRDPANNVKKIPVEPGQKYEFSGWLSTHGCRACVLLVVLDKAGNLLTAPLGNLIDHVPNSDTTENAVRSSVMLTMPAGAYSAEMRVRTWYTGASDYAHTFVAQLFFARCLPNQTEFSAWAPGETTVIHGNGIMTRTLNANKIVAESITANELAASSIVANKLAVGQGRNMLSNSDARIPRADGKPAGWDYWWNSPEPPVINIMPEAGDYYHPPGSPSLQLYYGAAPGPSGTISDIYVLRDTHPGESSRYPVQPGKRYEASAWISTHRCGARTYLFVYDRDSNLIAAYDGNLIDDYRIDYTAVNPTRSSVITPPLPSTAFSAAFVVRSYYDGRDYPYTFVSQCLLAEANLNQIEPSAWAPGVGVVMDGHGIVARTISADRIMASAITANEIAADAITVGKIAAGAVGASQIQADAISTKHLSIIDTSNMVNDWCGPSPNPAYPNIDGWSFSGLQGSYFEPSNIGSVAAGFGLVYANERDQCVASKWTPVKGGEAYHFSVMFFNTETAYDAGIVLFLKKQDGSVTAAFFASSSVDNSWETLSGNYTIPADVVGIKMSLTSDRPWGALGNSTYWAKPVMRRAANSSMIVDGAITAAKLSAGEVVTLSAQIKDAIITSAKVVSLDAAKIQANTVISNTVVVSGSTGPNLGNIHNWASDPASRVNEYAATNINPGKVLISGGTMLSDWRKGGDDTKIDGGAISANTITANKVTIGLRGIVIEGLQFEHNSPGFNQVSWTSGRISYTNAAGVQTYADVAAYAGLSYVGSPWYIYWLEGYAAIYATNDFATAHSTGSVVLAVYRGNTDLTVNYGRTVIDGDSIKTGTITATQIQAGAINSTALASDSVTAIKIAAGAIETDKLAANAITAAKIAANTITAGQIAAGTITATQIATRTITADRIVTGSITANELAANSITAGKIAALSISTGTIQIGAVSEDNLALFSATRRTSTYNASFTGTITQYFSATAGSTIIFSVRSSYVGNLAVQINSNAFLPYDGATYGHIFAIHADYTGTYSMSVRNLASANDAFMSAVVIQR